jgi:CRP-like cAMP-binding protein
LGTVVTEHPLFAELDDERASVVAGCAELVRFAPGTRIIEADRPADRFWLLRRGHVDVELHTAGRGTVVLARLGAGDLLGVSWIAPPYRSRFDATAGDVTTALQFDAACLRGKCEADPVLGSVLYRQFAGLMGERLQAARLQLLDMYGGAA